MINYLGAWRLQADGETGTVTVATSSRVSVEYPQSGITESYTGSFSYLGAVVLGTVTGFQASHGGVPYWTIEGMNASAYSIYSALTNYNPLSPNLLINLLLGGNDMVWGSVNGEPILAGPGNDTVIALDGNDTVLGGTGDDDINGNVGIDLVMGEAGADWVRGGRDNDTLDGGDGDDPHVNGNIGADVVRGGNGNDTVYGGQDQDTLYGEAGADLLSGDLGADILYGGAGADRFVLRAGSGTDWVADFSAAAGDRIQLSPGTTYSVTSLSGQVAISLGNGDQIGLAGIADGSFSSGWIVFG